MTQNNLQSTFTFPSGIDQLYVPRQDAIENTLYLLYEAAGYEMPKVYFFKSPLALQMATNYLNKKRRGVEMEIEFMKDYPSFSNALIYDELNTRSRQKDFWEFISVNVAAKGAKHISDSTKLIADFNKYMHLADCLENSVVDDVKKRLAIKGMEYVETSRHPHFKDIIWLLSHREFLDKLEDKDRNLFLIYYDLVRNGLMHAVLLEGAVFWCPLPTTFKINDLKQFHCGTGPAMQWNDDYGVYFWNGVKVRKRLIEYPETITRLDVLEETNLEIRECMKQRMGLNKFAALFTLLEVDSDYNSEGIEQVLWRTSHVDDLTRDNLFFAKLSDPESGITNLTEVPAGTSNVWEAMAFAFGESNPKSQSKVRA